MRAMARPYEVLLVIFWIWCLLFLSYIFLEFYTRPTSSWNTASDYSKSQSRIETIGIHFIGGSILLILAVPQIWTGWKYMRTGDYLGPRQYFCRWFRTGVVHALSGWLYLIGVFLASAGGCLFILIGGTVGGIQMDVAFFIYGVLLFLSTFMAVFSVMQRNYVKHARWAIRSFSLAIGSALYRVYVFPLVLMFLASGTFGSLSRSQQILWLNVCGWLMFVPNLLLAEWFIRKRLRGTGDVPVALLARGGRGAVGEAHSAETTGLVRTEAVPESEKTGVASPA